MQSLSPLVLSVVASAPSSNYYLSLEMHDIVCGIVRLWEPAMRAVGVGAYKPRLHFFRCRGANGRRRSVHMSLRLPATGSRLPGWTASSSGIKRKFSNCSSCDAVLRSWQL